MHEPLSLKVDPCVMPGAASAAFHESPRIMLAAVKFFLGQDDVADNSDDEADDDTVKAVNPTKAEIYNASKKVSLVLCPRSSPSHAQLNLKA